MLKIGKSTIIMGSVAAAVLGTLPAVAGLGDVWTDFQYYVTDFRNYITNNISDDFQPHEAQAQIGITSTYGALNVPNPNAAANSIRDQMVLNSFSDKFENNPAVYGRAVGNQVNRYITRSSVEGLLGRDGQERLKTKLEDTEKAVRDTAEFANKAEEKRQRIEPQIEAFGMDLPLPVPNPTNAIAVALAPFLQQQIKIAKLTLEGLSEWEVQNINIEREQSKMMGETLGNTIQMRNDLQYSNLHLADISQQMDEVNRARRVDTSAEVARLLRVTAQTDLFRKGNDVPPSLETNPLEEPNNPSTEEPNNPSTEEPNNPSSEDPNNPFSPLPANE